MCYDEQTLQEIIDQAYEGDSIQAMNHIKDCPECSERYEALKMQGQMIESALNMGIHIPPRQSIQEEFRLESIGSGKKRRFKGMKQIQTKWKAAAAVALCSVLLMTEPVQVMADSFLKLFRVQEMETVSITQEDIHEIDRLFNQGEGELTIDNIGTFEVETMGTEYEESDPENLEVFKELVPGVKVLTTTENLNYSYAAHVPKTAVNFTLDVVKTNEILAYLGAEEVLPQSLHQKTFQMVADSIFNYTLTNSEEDYSDKIYIHVSVMGEPQFGFPEDVDAQEVIEAMANSGLIPSGVKEQLMGFNALESVLPIPYSEDYQTKREIDIQGNKAIVIEEKDASDVPYAQVYLKDGDYFYVYNVQNIDVDDLILMIQETE